MRARGKPEAARKHFEETLAIRPDSSDAVRGLAALALEQQNYEEAYDAASQAARTWGNTAPNCSTTQG